MEDDTLKKGLLRETSGYTTPHAASPVKGARSGQEHEEKGELLSHAALTPNTGALLSEVTMTLVTLMTLMTPKGPRGDGE